MEDFEDLPPEVRAEIAGRAHAAHDDGTRLQALSATLAGLRDEAVKDRASSGIEQIWMECEEAYLGVDDANRNEMGRQRWAKPLSSDGPLTSDRKAGNGKSTAFVRLTSRYVDAGTAKLCEVLLPIDDKAFSFAPTPVPDLIAALEDDSPATGAMGQLLMQPGQPPQPGMPAPMQPVAKKDVAKAAMEQATEAAQKAEQRIYDWMVETKHASEMRKVIHDAARIGVGVLKGPFPDVRRSQAMVKVDAQTTALQIEDKVVPAERWVDPWNLFPDPACGEDIHTGAYLFERDYISAKTLRNLIGQPGYIADAVQQVLKEGPNKVNVNPGPHQKDTKKSFEIWYGYAEIDVEDVIACGGVKREDVADCEKVAVIATLVNDTVIRAVLNPLDSGAFPYQVIPWRRRAGSWAGVGVAEQCRFPQRLVNGATRAMSDNAGLSAGLQIIIDQGSVTPADGNWALTPNKIWLKNPDSVVTDVRAAFASVQFPNTQQQLMAIIEYGFRLAEESTSIPLITQGQSGKTTPDTFSGQQLQDNNANQLLRDIAASFDDCVTEPLVKKYYEWLLLDPDVPEEEKGDYQINTHGSVALVERAIQDYALLQMGQMVGNPVFGIDPKKWFEQMAKAKRLDPRTLQYSDEEMAQMQQQGQPPAPQVQVAQINAQARLQDTQMKLQAQQGSPDGSGNAQIQSAQIRTQADLQKAQLVQQADMVELQFKAQQAELQRQHEMALKNMELQIEMMKLSNDKNISLEEIKSQLARDSMKLATQKELTYATHNAPQVATPAVEPPGRAPNGQAFQA